MKEIYGYFITESGEVFNKHGKKLTPSDNGRGYLVLGLRCDGTRKTIGVHKLVALAYIDNPDNLPEVNHKDGNKLNNHRANLAWCTRAENIAHAYLIGLRSARGTDNARCLTDETTVKEICALLETGQSPSNIRDMGYKYDLVRKIKARTNWKHISKDYSF